MGSCLGVYLTIHIAPIILELQISYTLTGLTMFFFFMVVALIFLIAGGFGLFYTNINLEVGSPYWIHGNITYGTFTILGILTLILLAIFGSEIE